MSKEFDPTLKVLVETSPADWLPLIGRPPAPVSIIDADVATVISAAADKFLHVHAEPEYVLHLEFQSGHDSASLPGRLRLYNTAADYRTGLLVRSVAVLLHSGADSPRLTGHLVRAFPGEEPESVFRYQVMRVWQLPVGPLLEGGLGTLPLAPISAVNEADLPRVIQQMKRRLRREPREKDLWTATRILLGLRYSHELIDLLLQGVAAMKESTTYQAIVAEGRTEGRAEGQVEEARRLLLLLGTKHLGEPDARTRARVEAIQDVKRLEALFERADRARTWQALVGRRSARRHKD